MKKIRLFSKINEEESIGLKENERRIYTEKVDRSIFELYRLHKMDKLVLQPDFQRLHVWDNKKASLLVESVLLDIPLPVIYLNEESDGTFSVVDGQQRLTALFDFFENKFKLNYLMVLKEIKGRKFQDLPPKEKHKFENASIRVIQLKKIFPRYKIRNLRTLEYRISSIECSGTSKLYLSRKIKEKDLLYIIKLSEPHKRMKDVELVLRFLAFQHQSYQNYKSPMKRFLNNEMAKY